MNEIQSQPGTALTVPQRAQLAMNSAQTRIDIAKMLEDSKAVTVITNPDGRAQAHSMLMKYVQTRTTLDKLYTGVSEDTRIFLGGLRDERDALKEEFAPEEARLRTLRDEWDKKEADAKKAKVEAEARRIADIQKRIEDDIRCVPVHAAGRSAKDVAVMLADIESIAIDDSFQEFKQQAEGAKATTLVKLRLMLTAAENLEEQQRQVANERRLSAIRARLQAIRAFPNGAAGKSAAQIADLRESLRTQATGMDAEQFGELAGEAREAYQEATSTLTGLWEARKLHEAEQARVVAQELDRRRVADIQMIKSQLAVAIIGTDDADITKARHAVIKVCVRTEGFAVTEAEYGDRYAEALQAKGETLVAIRALLKKLDEREAAEKATQDERDRIAKEAQKLADDQAELERQKAAAKLAQETVAPPSDPVEATKDEAVQALVEELTAPANGDPTDDEIIDVIARTWFVPETTAIEWIIAVADRQRDMVAA